MRRIALVNASPQGPASALLDDFSEAFAVYERLSAQAFGEKIGAVCEKAAVCDGTEQESAEHAEHRYDTAILAIALDTEEDAAKLQPGCVAADAQDALAKLPARTPIYVLATAGGADVQPARALLAHLEKACRARDFAWMGSLLVTDAKLVASVRRTARMGVWRRRTSEAVDELIAHVRAKQSAGVLEVAHPIPRALRPLAQLIYGHRL